MTTSWLETLIKRKFSFDFKPGPNGEIVVKCPFCPKRSKNKYKLYINVGKDMYNCFRCGASGRATEIAGVPVKALEVEQNRKNPEERIASVHMPGVTIPLNESPFGHPVYPYLKGRKRIWDIDELSDVYQLALCTTGRKYQVGDAIFDTSNTIILPVFLNGEIVGWQSRLLYEPDDLSSEDCRSLGWPQDEDGDFCRPPKYFTSPGLKKSRILFNFDMARKFPFVVVTEGPFDAMSVGLSAVATLGKGVTQDQARIIKAYWSSAIIMLDPGDADKDAAKLLNNLSLSIPTVKVTLEGYKDPGDAPRDEIWRQVAKAIESERSFPMTVADMRAAAN